MYILVVTGALYILRTWPPQATPIDTPLIYMLRRAGDPNPTAERLALVGVSQKTTVTRSDGDDKLWVDVGEAGELGLVEVHNEQFVGRRQLGRLARELAVKVAHVFYGFLHTTQTDTHIQGGAKNGASLSHCKYSENSMIELRGNW